MGVYIDIEMPRCCADCAFFVQLAGSDVTECVMPEGRVEQWCPLEEADRKTENSSEKPNNCKAKNYCDDCLYTDTCDSKEFFYACTSKATISKMEQVDKDINVRSKDEPQTDCPWK